MNLFGLAIGLLVGLAAATAVLMLVRYLRRARPRPAGGWQPTVEHRELPAPADDPRIGWPEPVLGAGRITSPPLPGLGLSAGLRSALDGFALGRAKRVLDAPDLLRHAADDPESWPHVEQAVTRVLEAARGLGIQFAPAGGNQLHRALALCAAHGVLLAEWRQLEDGETAWNGAVPKVRASDAFTIQRVTEGLERHVLPDLFAGIERRPCGVEVLGLVRYAVELGFHQRLRGRPPTAFARVSAG